MTKVTVSIDEEIVEILQLRAKDWRLVSEHTVFRMSKGKQPSRAEVVECALIKFIRAHQE